MKSGFKAILLRKDEFLFCAILILSKIFIGVQFLYSVVLVSALQQSESAVYVYIHTYIHTCAHTHTHIYIYIYIHTHTHTHTLSFWISLPFMSPQSIKSSSLCYTVGSHQLSVLCIIVYICQSQFIPLLLPHHTILILSDSTCFILHCGESSFMIDFSLFTFCSGIPWGQEMKVLPFAHHLPTCSFVSVDILQQGGLRYL